MPTIWLCGGFGWLCPAFRYWRLELRCWMFDVPDREPSRFAAGRNGLGCWTFWRLIALVAAASRDGSRAGPVWRGWGVGLVFGLLGPFSPRWPLRPGPFRGPIQSLTQPCPDTSQ